MERHLFAGVSNVHNSNPKVDELESRQPRKSAEEEKDGWTLVTRFATKIKIKPSNKQRTRKGGKKTPVFWLTFLLCDQPRRVPRYTHRGVVYNGGVQNGMISTNLPSQNAPEAGSRCDQREVSVYGKRPWGILEIARSQFSKRDLLHRLLQAVIQGAPRGHL